MLNEKKIRLMTELARYESGEGKEDLRIVRKHRGDYIVMGLLKNFLLTTLGYLLIWVAIIAYNMEYLLENIHKVKIGVVTAEFLTGYFAFLILYSVFIWIRRRRRYEQAKDHVQQYYDGLEELSSTWYGQGEKHS